jgi:hypothetical protein
MPKSSLVNQEFPFFLQNGSDPAADTAAEMAAATLDTSVDLDDSWQVGLSQYDPPPPISPHLTPAPPAAAGTVSGAIGPVTADDGSGVGDTGDMDVNGPQARSTFDLDGTGMRIGIISDSFDAGGASASAVTTEEGDGDLPATVTVLSDASTGTDEGRAMAELVHKIAPGAQIYFATWGGNESASAQAVASLEAAGCNVIVDDISWTSSEPFYQDGSPLQSAIEAATAAGVSYFTSAGNQSNHYYEGTVGTFPTLEISVTISGSIDIDLQWTQPFGTIPAGSAGSAYSLGWTLYDHNTSTVVASQTTDLDGQNPVQEGLANVSAGDSYDLVIADNGSGSLVTTDTYKVIVLSSNPESVTVSGAGVGIGSGTVFGHELPSSVNVVGAVYAPDPTTVEPYSAYGPGELYYDASGNPLGTPLDEHKPNFLAPDYITTSVAGFSTFAGTSAAAPDAAAVGALLLQINPNLTPAEITAALAATASTSDITVGNTAQEGAGLINADAAAELLYDGSTVVNGTTVYNGTSASFASVLAWNHTSATWNTAADWSAAATPAATSYVTLGDNLGALATNYTVTLDTAAGTVNTLTVGNAGSLSTALSITSGGSLIVAGGAWVGHDGQVTIAGSGSLQVDGLLQLDDTSGATATVTLQSSAEVAAGSFDIVGGDATVASGASLAVSGSGTLGEGDDGTLSVTGGATVGGNLSVDQTGLLAIDTGGSLGVGGTLSLQAGDTAAIGAGGTLSAASLSGGNFFLARGHLTIDNGGVLVVSSSASSYLTGPIGGLETTIIEHAGGSTSDTHAHILLTGIPFASQTLSYLSLNGRLSIDTSGTLVAELGFDKTQGLTLSSFSTADVAGNLEINIACYLHGTRIATRAGEVPVEALRIGDEVLTVSGALRPIRWIGRRSYTAAQAEVHPSLRPIRIAAGALGPLRPRRDLLVSTQHALLLRDPGDGQQVLVPAVQLINGVTIAREPAGAEISYCHIELAVHDAILAEGQPAETFVDRVSRAAFANAHEYARLYPGAAGEFVPFCAPRIEGGAALARIRAAIEDWSGLLPGRLIGAVDRVDTGRVEGWAHDPDMPAGPVLLEILVDDALAGVLLADQFRPDLQAMNGGHCAYFFAMPAGQEIGIASRVTVRRARDGREVPRTAASLAADRVALVWAGTQAGAPVPA